MSLLAQVGEAPAPSRAPDQGPDMIRGRRTWLQPGWPLTFLFGGFPLWWVLGVSSFVGIFVGLLLTVELVRQRRIRMPDGFLPWALFLVWLVAGVFVLQVAAPGTSPGGGSGRYLTFGYRVSWYLAATAVLLYVVNKRRQLSTTRLVRTAGLMFLSIVAGGWLGILAPHLDFPSVLEALLPHSVTRIKFVDILIHPQVTQLYQGAATDTPRPSAPFAYANIWGLNFACFLPFFIASWCGKHAGWRRPLAPFLLLLALVPAVQSLNRGLWLALIAMALLVAIRSAIHGRVGLLLGLIVGVAVVAMFVVKGPAAELISHRLDNPTSNSTRTNLALQTTETVAISSPVIGLGTTRDVQGNFDSIAGGSTPQCPLCSPPALGTQGHLWLVLFSQGVGGLLLYLGFYVYQFWRGIRVRSGIATMGLAVIVAHLITMPVYDSLGMSMLAQMIAVGLLWRERQEQTDRLTQPSPAGPVYLDQQGAFLRRHAGLVAITAFLGLAAGGAWQLHRGDPAIATTSITLPAEPTYLTVNATAQTLDTDAQLARTPRVLDAIEAASGQPAAEDNLHVSADPNTRVLNLRYQAPSPQAALRGVRAAARTTLKVRGDDLTERQAQALASLQTQSRATDEALHLLGTSQNQARSLAASAGVEPTHELDGLRSELLRQAGLVNSWTVRASRVQVDPGRVIRQPSVHTTRDGWRVALPSGLVLGLLGGLAAGSVRDRRDRVARSHRTLAKVGLPVLATVDNAELSSLHEGWNDARIAAFVHQPLAVLAVDQDGASCSIANQLDRECLAEARLTTPGDEERTEKVFLVVTPKTKSSKVFRMKNALEAAHLTTTGLVLVTTTHRK